MLDGFVPMRAWLERGDDSAPVPDTGAELDREPEPFVEPQLPNSFEDEIDVAIGEARRFRAALADALDACVEELLRDVAGDVLARELRLAPCDVRAIVERAVERYGVDPLCIRVNSADARAFEATGEKVVVDDRVRGGDVFIDIRQGSIDASLGARLERVLAPRIR
ncbi:MAG: hypothetical protein JO322_10170 [Candidatus Eremiobacteraeota bacterium]|nr:hypothetical protein [Candidatus Eremiobacteraeota bacterium]